MKRGCSPQPQSRENSRWSRAAELKPIFRVSLKSFKSACATLAGIEVAHMIRKHPFDMPEQSGFAQFAALAG